MKMIKYLPGLFLVIFMLTSGNYEIVYAKVDCKNAETTAELHECSAEEYGKADKELNRVYKELVSLVEKSGGKSAKEKLVLAQRAWITFRDKECDFSTLNEEGGSLYPIVYNGCMTSLTESRTKGLKVHLKSYKEME